MILFNPPVAAPYIPASQKIAKVYGSIQRDEGLDLLRVQLVLINTNGKRISRTRTQCRCRASRPADRRRGGVDVDAGEGHARRALSRALLPIVDANLGLQGGVVE